MTLFSYCLFFQFICTCYFNTDSDVKHRLGRAQVLIVRLKQMNWSQLLQQLVEVHHPGFRRMRALSREKEAFVHKVPFFFTVGPTGLSAERFRSFLS